MSGYDAVVKIGSLPGDDATCGWWHTLPLPPASATPLRATVDADCAIIGAGFTGLAVARRLAEHRPNWRIVVLDAQRAGFSTAGRNSGFVGDIAHLDPDVTDEAAAHEREVAQAGMTHLRQLVQERQIDCQWSDIGRLHVAVEKKALANLDHLLEMLARFDVPHTPLDANGVEAILGCRYYARGVHIPATVLVQPAALARGVAAALPENVRLFEESPVVEMDLSKPVVLTTPKGSVRADLLAVTANGFVPALGFLKRRIVPLWTFASLTEPLTPEQLGQVGGAKEWGLVSEDRMGTSMRRTQDGRFLIRNSVRYNGRFSGNGAPYEKFRALHKKALVDRYPMLESVVPEYTWGGLLGMTLNQGQYWGQLEPHVFATAGYNGTGIAKGTGSGMALADRIAGVDSELAFHAASLAPPSWVPPRPLVDVGVYAMTTFLQSRAGRER